jgi:hypothetical protein
MKIHWIHTGGASGATVADETGDRLAQLTVVPDGLGAFTFTVRTSDGVTIEGKGSTRTEARTIAAEAAREELSRSVTALAVGVS